MSAPHSPPFFDAKEIYVLCPGHIVSGGPELLHQLVAELRRINRQAYIVYYPSNREWTTPPEYERYGCPVALSPPDRKDVAVIVPEVATRFLDSFNQAKRIIWWLSVNNYRGSFENMVMKKLWIKRTIDSAISSPSSVFHLFQSRYAEEFVRQRFKATGWMLSDYLADEFLTQNTYHHKLDLVAFNPTKGFRTTRRIIRQAPHIHFEPLIKMSRSEVRSMLASAKIYIDFGYHPGKDRIPREAAMSGCVVIVGRRGSAEYSDDVPIESMYKCPTLPWRSRDIVHLIDAVLSNYQKHYDSQHTYRTLIRREREVFTNQVRDLFGASIC